MFLEAPVDAWYVWLGAAVLSVGLAGVAMSLPATPPPDATGTANAIERAAAVPGTFVTYDHQATATRYGRATLSLRTAEAVAHSTITLGQLVPATGNERLLAVLAGTDPAVVYDSAGEWQQGLVRDLQRAETVTGRWHPSGGRLRARSIAVADIAGPTVVLVDG